MLNLTPSQDIFNDASLLIEGIEVVNPSDIVDESALTSCSPGVKATHFIGHRLLGKILPIFEESPQGFSLLYAENTGTTNIVFNKFVSGATTPLILHTDTDLQLIVTRGVLILEVYLESKFSRYRIGCGVGWCIPRGTPHRLLADLEAEFISISNSNLTDDFIILSEK
jgi:hypothetical protein